MAFKKLQALAFVPIRDVIKSFELLENSSPKTFKPMLKYFLNNYIGKFKKNSMTSRVEPRFPICIWNLHDRVKKNLPRTNNNVESWHGKVTQDTKKNLTVNKAIELFRKEQGLMECNYVKLVNGEVLHTKSVKMKSKDENIARLVKSYSFDKIEEFLIGIGNNMGEQKI